MIYREFSVDIGVVEVYQTENDIRTHKKLEIDFVANKGSKRYYLQSAFAIPDTDKMNREQQSLINVPDSFKKMIIVESNSPLWHNEQGVTIMSIYDFCWTKTVRNVEYLTYISQTDFINALHILNPSTDMSINSI